MMRLPLGMLLFPYTTLFRSNIVFRYIGATMSKVVTERMVKSFLDLFVLDLLDDSPKHGYEIMRELKTRTGARIDRKSTRLNSSHVAISYAVFCLKKKNLNQI